MRVSCPVLDLRATRSFFSDFNVRLVNCEKLRPEGCLKSYFEKKNNDVDLSQSCEDQISNYQPTAIKLASSKFCESSFYLKP